MDGGMEGGVDDGLIGIFHVKQVAFSHYVANVCYFNLGCVCGGGCLFR